MAIVKTFIVNAKCHPVHQLLPTFSASVSVRYFGPG